MPRSNVLPLLAVLCWACIAPPAARAEAAWHEDFEGPTPSWHELGSDTTYRILKQQRVRGQAHTGQGCEWLQVAADNGSTVFISHDVGRPWVIDELLPAVWVFADRPGLQLAADIVLPRAIDSHTGRPMLARVFGTSYNTAGHWQQLRVEGIPQLLMRRLREMRSQLGQNVDGREAYVERLALNVYGGRGVTNVWIDDLEVAGFVASGRKAASPAPARPAAATIPAGAAVRPDTLPAAGPGNQSAPPRPGVQLSGSVLLADGQPFFPRVIQYQGEPLPLLKQLGFNAVWLKEMPAVEFAEEARRLGLWLVCPPPRPASDAAGAAPALAPFGPEFQQVLAWDLGSDLIAEQLPGLERWAEQVRAADTRTRRPLICAARNELRGFSRQVDVLLIDRRPLGSSMELADYAAWVRRQPLLAQPGTPVWTTVQTQPNDGLRRQLTALDPGLPLPAAVAGEQLRLLVYTAVSAGSRGLLFLSQSPLSATDADTRGRAMDLELLNLELQLIEPWAAGGTFVTTAKGVAAGPAAKPTLAVASTQVEVPEISAAVLRTDRARLVLPLWTASGAQCVSGQADPDEVTLVVPGTPESTLAYEVAAGRLQPLRKQRGTGGIRVSLDHFGLSGMVLFAQDPLIVEAVMRRAAASGNRQIQLECALAEQKYRQVRQVLGQLGGTLPPATAATQRLADADKNLALCRRELAANQFPAALIHARQTVRPLRLLEQACWLLATKGPVSPVASPGTASFATLPWHWGLMRRLATFRPGPNRLPGGDFERLDVMQQTGWRHYQHKTPSIEAAADVVPEAAHSGRFGLRLTARADDPAHPPAMLETPPLWITSPPVPVLAGQLLRIHGWVNIPLPIAGSVDGLRVVDSLAGDDLAQRIDKTSGWKEFTLYRVALQPGDASITFILSGLGEVRLDDVTIQVLEPAGTNIPARRFASGASGVSMDGNDAAQGNGYGTTEEAAPAEASPARTQAFAPGQQLGVDPHGSGPADPGAGEHAGDRFAGGTDLRPTDCPDREGHDGHG